MCKDCLLELFPDRGDCCLDEGHYLMNVKSCISCGTRGRLRVENRIKTETEDTDDLDDSEFEEEVTFVHVCDNCNHEVAKHLYSFTVGKEDGGLIVQNYIMACSLCGRGGDRRVVEEVSTAGVSTAEASSETKTTTTTTTTTTTLPTMVTGFTESSLLDRVTMQGKKNVDKEDDEDSDEW